MPRSAPDEELSARQSLLRQEAAALLADLERSGILAGIGPLALAGSYVSELMSWRDLDVMLRVGADYSPRDVLHLISQLIDLPGVMRDSIIDDQRAAVLRIKDVWFRLPNYPDQISGIEIYTAVLEDEVRIPSQFSGWLAARGLSVS